MDFFITGLPRSKTAWASMYFTRGKCICHHELIAQFGINKCLNFKSNPEILEGNSDAGVMILWKSFIEKFPYAPWVNIIRDYEDVLESAVEFGISELNIRFAIEKQEEFRKEMQRDARYLEIPFDFNDRDLEMACEHIGVEYSQYHTDRMRKYNIQMSEYQKDKLMMSNNLDSL